MAKRSTVITQEDVREYIDRAVSKDAMDLGAACEFLEDLKGWLDERLEEFNEQILNRMT